jgi:DNA-binding beta-propeller fold protein YncE
MGGYLSRTGLTNNYGAFWSDDGVHYFVLQDNGGTEKVHKWTCPTPFTTAGYSKVGTTGDIGSVVAAPRGLSVHPEGTFFYVTGAQTVYEFSMPVPWDPRNAVFVRSKSVGVTIGTATGGGLCMSGDGMKIITCNGGIRTFDMSAPFDISTLPTGASSYKALHANNDNYGDCDIAGNKLYVADWLDDRVYQYTI